MSQYLQRLLNMTAVHIASHEPTEGQVLGQRDAQPLPAEVHEETESKSRSQHVPVYPSAIDLADSETTEKKVIFHGESLSQTTSSAYSDGDRVPVQHETEAIPSGQESVSRTESPVEDEELIIHPDPEGNPVTNIEKAMPLSSSDSILNDAFSDKPDVFSGDVSLESSKTRPTQSFHESDRRVEADEKSPVSHMQKKSSDIQSNVSSDPFTQDDPIQAPRHDHEDSHFTHPTYRKVRTWVAESKPSQQKDTQSMGMDRAREFQVSKPILYNPDQQESSSKKSTTQQTQQLEVQDVQLSIGDIHLTVEAPQPEMVAPTPPPQNIRNRPEHNRWQNRLERHYLRF